MVDVEVEGVEGRLGEEKGGDMDRLARCCTCKRIV